MYIYRPYLQPLAEWREIGQMAVERFGFSQRCGHLSQLTFSTTTGGCQTLNNVFLESSRPDHLKRKQHPVFCFRHWQPFSRCEIIERKKQKRSQPPMRNQSVLRESDVAKGPCVLLEVRPAANIACSCREWVVPIAGGGGCRIVHRSRL